ncbi:MAG: protein kinase [Nostocoides sp.]
MTDRVVAGRYRLTSPLGRGGMSVVWRAKDVLLGREVAVKTLDLTGPDSDSWAERFRREALATAGLNHPNIVTVYDTGVEHHTAYLVMELLPGPTLAEEVRDRGVLPIASVRSIGLQICSALAAAHAAGIVHRDIKPANVAYAADGRIRVLDFGINQLMNDPGQALTRTNTVLGTADYLAPEQAAGGRVDARADLYAFACVLTTLLTGGPPFHGETPVATMLQHARAAIPDVRALRPDTPPDLADLIRQLLAKEPADRPQSADVVTAMLRGELQAAAPVTTVLPVTTAVLSPTLTPSAADLPLPVVSRATRPISPSRGRGWVPWLILALLLVAVAAYALTHRGAITTQTPPSTPSVSSMLPSTTTSTTRTTSTTSSSTTTTSTTTSSPPATSETATNTADPAAALEDLRYAVAMETDAGGVDAQAAPQLTSQLDAIGTALTGNGGKAVKAVKAVNDFGDLVQSLVQEQHITADGAAALADPYNALKTAVGS